MNRAVIYYWQPFNKINGTLFYCIEYYLEIMEASDVSFYIVDISGKDLKLVYDLFEDKYKKEYFDKIQIKTITRTKICSLNLDKTLILDIKTLERVKYFLTGDVISFQNDTYDLFRYKNDRTIRFYGSYSYQNRDYDSYLKLGLRFQKSCLKGQYTFVSGVNLDTYELDIKIQDSLAKQQGKFYPNLFDMIHSVAYYHTKRDTNNRIVVEAHYHDKKIIELNSATIKDSFHSRNKDCNNGMINKYILSNSDLMIIDMLKEDNVK